MSGGETHELQLRFEDAATKRAVLAWLAERGVTSLAEGVIDGVEDALEDPELAFADESDRAPVLVYDESLAALEALAKDVGARFPTVDARLATLSDEAWSRAWNDDAVTIQTERFFVRPADFPGATPAGLVPLTIRAGAAFGSGRHATTQVCLEVLERLPAAVKRGRLLDVGTGTGILAVAAFSLGFAELAGTDIDDEVLAEARDNAALNGASVRLEKTEVPSLAEGKWDVVAANILAPVLHQLMPTFAQLLAPGGALLLAGFIDKEAGPLVAAAAKVGLVVRERRECRGWVGLRLQAAT